MGTTKNVFFTKSNRNFDTGGEWVAEGRAGGGGEKAWGNAHQVTHTGCPKKTHFIKVNDINIYKNN